jgi:hypothetical protein
MISLNEMTKDGEKCTPVDYSVVKHSDMRKKKSAKAHSNVLSNTSIQWLHSQRQSSLLFTRQKDIILE